MNQAINFFWNTISFIPIFFFWIHADMMYCYIFIGISFLSLFIPAKRLQLSNDAKFYEPLKVKLIRKFVQHGEYVNKFKRNYNPQHKIIKDSTTAKAYFKTIAMYERYHFLCFVFFLLTGILAIISSRYTWAVFIFLANAIYNICPILLQQYNHARVQKLTRK